MLRQASDGPDLSDPTVRTVTISGGRPALVGAYHLFKAIEEAVAEELDRTTPGMWHIVCMSIDPERVSNYCCMYLLRHLMLSKCSG